MALTNVNDLQNLRPVGLQEKWSTARHHLGFCNNVGVSVQYIAHGPTNLKPTIFVALSAVISQHSILSAIPVNEDTREPYFARLREIDLERAVSFVARREPFNGSGRDKELDELLEIQNNTSFKDSYGSLPFWRLIILTNPSANPGLDFVVSFIFHHALGDGLSGVAFHNSFFTALRANRDTLPSTVIPTPKAELLPELEKLHSLPLPKWTIPGEKPGLWTGEVVKTPLISRFQSLAISNEITSAFVKVCRAHGTTVTAAIQVLIAVAIFHAVPEESTDLVCLVPVSIRRWLPPPVDETSMGNYVDGLMEHYQRHNLEEFSWAEAIRSTETVKKYMAGSGEYLGFAMIKHVKDFIGLFLSQVGKKRARSFDVSNLGAVARLDEGHEGPGKNWERGRMVFSRCASVTENALSVGLATGNDGCLVVGVTWQEGIVETSMVDFLMERVEEGIKALAQGNEQ